MRPRQRTIVLLYSSLLSSSLLCASRISRFFTSDVNIDLGCVLESALGIGRGIVIDLDHDQDLLLAIGAIKAAYRFAQRHPDNVRTNLFIDAISPFAPGPVALLTAHDADGVRHHGMVDRLQRPAIFVVEAHDVPVRWRRKRGRRVGRAHGAGPQRPVSVLRIPVRTPCLVGAVRKADRDSVSSRRAHGSPCSKAASGGLSG